MSLKSVNLKLSSKHLLLEKLKCNNESNNLIKEHKLNQIELEKL